MPDKFTHGLYALEKLVEAVCALDVADNLRAGLFDAATYVLRVRSDQVPAAELRRALCELRRDFTSAKPIGAEGSLVATLQNMSDSDAAALAGRVRALHLRLKRQVG